MIVLIELLDGAPAADVKILYTDRLVGRDESARAGRLPRFSA
jgi:hypothetical protein